MISLGCPKNTVDGEVILGDLQAAGYVVTSDTGAADTLIVNTCAFVEDAKSESLDTILAAADAARDDGGHRRQRLVVTGCMAQRYGADLAAALPEVDDLVGFEAYADLPRRLAAPRPGRSESPDARVAVGGPTVPFRGEGRRVRLPGAASRHSAYLRVAEGCDHACSFCAIPGFRGRFRSKPWDAVVAEAAALVATGVVELNLIAEDTNQYGMDRRSDGHGLAQLLRALSALDGLRWIRILYAYPSYFSDALIDEIAANPKVCKYIDMPLQHMSNLTLLAMNRPPRGHTESLLRTLRARIPRLALRTTFISGFPGETDAQHAELVAFCRDFKFERMGAFAYSEEDGTPAAVLPGQVDLDIRAARRDELIALQQRAGERWARRMIGRTLTVLVDGREEEDGADSCGAPGGDEVRGALGASEATGEGREGVSGGASGSPAAGAPRGWVGRTEWDAPDIDHVVLLSDRPAGAAPLAAGQLRRVLITDTVTFDLVGHPVDTAEEVAAAAAGAAGRANAAEDLAAALA